MSIARRPSPNAKAKAFTRMAGHLRAMRAWLEEEPDGRPRREALRRELAAMQAIADKHPQVYHWRPGDHTLRDYDILDVAKGLVENHCGSFDDCMDEVAREHLGNDDLAKLKPDQKERLALVLCDFVDGCNLPLEHVLPAAEPNAYKPAQATDLLTLLDRAAEGKFHTLDKAQREAAVANLRDLCTALNIHPDELKLECE